MYRDIYLFGNSGCESSELLQHKPQEVVTNVRACHSKARYG
jgi:hypothetical protein